MPQIDRVTVLLSLSQICMSNVLLLLLIIPIFKVIENFQFPTTQCLFVLLLFSLLKLELQLGRNRKMIFISEKYFFLNKKVCQDLLYKLSGISLLILCSIQWDSLKERHKLQIRNSKKLSQVHFGYINLLLCYPLFFLFRLCGVSDYSIIYTFTQSILISVLEGKKSAFHL